MRRKDKAINDQSVIEILLNSAQVCRIGFADAGMPYIVPVNFAYQNNCIYIHSSREGRKIEMAEKNNYVCFEIEDNSEVISSEIPCNVTTRYRSLIGYGNISVIDKRDEKVSALNIIVRKFSVLDSFSYPDSMLDRIVILKIEITEISGKQSRM